MAFRLPSQKKFKPKLGSRPGGPTTGGGPPRAPSASFALPRVPEAATRASSAAPTAPASATTRAIPEETDGNAVAGPSSRPDLPPGLRSGDEGSPAPGLRTSEDRHTVTPVAQLNGLPPTIASSPDGPSRDRSRSPPAGVASVSAARASVPGISPTASGQAVLEPSNQTKRTSVDATRPPLAVPKPRRAPSASPAPTIRKPPPPRPISTRVSASPAPSARQRSMSRQASLTPSMRSGGRPALIAAAENRTSPLNIPPSAKERRKAEKAREAADRESARGTPAPVPANIPGLPPSLAAAPDSDGDVDMESTNGAGGSDTESRAGQGERESTAVIAARLMDQLRASATPAPRPSADPVRIPLFFPGADDEDEGRSANGRDGGSGGEESDSGEEEYDGATGQIIRKGGKAVTQPRQKAPKAAAGPKAIKRTVAPQRKKYKRQPKAKETEEEVDDDDEDEELNELDISDNDDLSLSQPTRKRNSKRKRRAPRSPLFQSVNLELAEVGEMIGETVDEESVRMGEIATKRSGEGKVSARAKELSVYLRDFNQRNRNRLDDESNDRYERRQILRRQIRAIRNGKRAEKREAVRANGGDPDAEVTADEMDSETEFESKPERLTPEGTPEPAGQGANQVDDDGIEEEEYVEPPEGTNRRGDDDDDEDDGEGVVGGGEEPEEETFDPATHRMDERHEDEERQGDDDEEGFDPELAAMGFGPAGPTVYAEGDDEVYDEGAGESMEDLYDQIHQNRRTAQRFNETREVVEEEQTGKMPNNRSYAKRVNNERWSHEETEFFYQVLGETGENYTLMSFYFPSRTPRQLKNKGKKENAAHPDRVNEAIRARRPIDPDYLQKTVGYDPGGPTEDADQLLEETRDLPARWTREDTDRGLKDIAEEDEDGDRVEEVNYDDVAAAAAVDGEDDEAADKGEEDEDEDKGDEDEDMDQEDGEEEEDDQDAGQEY